MNIRTEKYDTELEEEPIGFDVQFAFTATEKISEHSGDYSLFKITRAENNMFETKE